MFPLLLSIGSFHLYSISVFIVVSWLAFSFLLWRNLRAQGIGEDAIFDLTFYAAIVAFVGARIGFIVMHWNLFTGKSILLMVALWVEPGLSWLAALIGGVGTVVYLCRQRKVRLGLVLDALPISLGTAIIIGKIGNFLDGSELGKATHVIWAVRYAAQPAPRHPVQLYEILAMGVVLVAISRLAHLAKNHKWAYGMVGVCFFGVYSAVMFALEFAKDSRVYWGSITANQWILIGIFAECIGVLYVRGGGREHVRPFFRSIGNVVRYKANQMYAKFSRRHPHPDKDAS